ncbi:MAG: hypothetical protein NTY53_00945, partial [Kiritimatiellaeota bacterium]|nr:hypothetical protein [Kiritimatiellota bacterium]
MKRIIIRAALLLAPLAALHAADAPAKAGRFPVYRSYAEMSKATVPLLPEVVAVTAGPKAHWFGYYDKDELDPSGRYLLGMEVGFEHRLPKSGEAVKIGMVDLQDGNRWIELGESRAWCWQQGCMLQWRPGSDREVVWNDREGDRFVSRVLDVKTRKLRTLPRAVGHISPDGKLAVCEDFSRVWNFRSGYGYAGIPDPYAAQPAPVESGVWRMDMETGATKLLVSLADLVQIPYPNQKAGDKHYVNHLEWSPDGKRLLLYDRWSGSGGMPTRVFTVAADGTDVRLLSKTGASHYIWRDPENVLIWTTEANGYALFKDDNTAQVGEVLWKAPNGHQLYIPGTGKQWLVSDTYARELYLYHLPTKTFVLLGKFPQDKAYAGEWRCDLHPRVSRDGKYVFFDSPHAGNGRQLYRIDISEITRQSPTAAAPAKSGKAAAAPGNPAIELPPWAGSADPVFAELAFGSKATRYRIYGGDRDAQMLYPKEWLPALFRRTLVLKAPLGAASELSWRFTGPQAGVDILANAHRLIIRPRFYDTPGYNEIQGKAGRHPEWSAAQEWALTGTLQAVTVQIDQGMNLSVSLNGQPVFERKWGYDLTQHQLALKGGGELPVQLLGPAPSNAVVTVNPSALHQRMSGFGGITTPTAYAELSAAGKRQWWQLVAEYNLLIQRE